MKAAVAFLFITLSRLYISTVAFSSNSVKPVKLSYQSTTSLYAKDDRRSFLNHLGGSLGAAAPLLLLPELTNAAAVPVQRAVGSGELQCRQEGNCLEKFEVSVLLSWL